MRVPVPPREPLGATVSVPVVPSYPVAVVEALHDLSRPIETLRAMRGLLVQGGTVIVADEKTAEVFAPPAGEAERLFYGYSITCCLPAAASDSGP